MSKKYFLKLFLIYIFLNIRKGINILVHTHLSIQTRRGNMALIFFLKCILKRVRTVGPHSILIENCNLNFATTMSQTVYALYCKYEYCNYLKKINPWYKICMHDEQSLHEAVYVKLHDAIHETCMRPYTYAAWGPHKPFYFLIFLMVRLWLYYSAVQKLFKSHFTYLLR